MSTLGERSADSIHVARGAPRAGRWLWELFHPRCLGGDAGSKPGELGRRDLARPRSLDFRVIDGEIELRQAIDDGDVIIALGLETWRPSRAWPERHLHPRARPPRRN